MIKHNGRKIEWTENPTKILNQHTSMYELKKKTFMLQHTEVLQSKRFICWQWHLTNCNNGIDDFDMSNVDNISHKTRTFFDWWMVTKENLINMCVMCIFEVLVFRYSCCFELGELCFRCYYYLWNKNENFIDFCVFAIVIHCEQ